MYKISDVNARHVMINASSHSSLNYTGGRKKERKKERKRGYEMKCISVRQFENNKFEWKERRE